MTDAIYAAGFGSPSRVYEDATGVLGMTPRAYGSGGRGEQIRFTTVSTRLGVMLVAATDRGLCRVALGDAPAALEQRLRAEFPAADVRSDRTGLVEPRPPRYGPLRPASRLDSPLTLDVRATAFQRRVWRALQAIAAGQTRTYAEVARQIGQARVGQGRRQGLRHQSGCARRPVPSRRPGGGRHRGISLGQRKKEEAAGR